MPGCPSRVTRVGIRPTYHFQGNRYEDNRYSSHRILCGIFVGWVSRRHNRWMIARLCRIIRWPFRTANYPGIYIRNFLNNFKNYSAAICDIVRALNRLIVISISLCILFANRDFFFSSTALSGEIFCMQSTSYLFTEGGVFRVNSCIYSCHGMEYLLHLSHL